VSAWAGWCVDLVNDGVRIDRDGRKAVVMALRRIMLSGNRTGKSYEDFHRLLTKRDSRLWWQVRDSGPNGRPRTPVEVERLLRKHWQQTATIAEDPAWDADVVAAILADCREALDLADALGPQDRAVLSAIFELAEHRRTTRPTAPVRVIAERAGLSRSSASRIMIRLHNEGRWIRRVQSGNYRTGRASLYSLAPTIALTQNLWGGFAP
jgi:hypothetical protein